MSMKPNTKVSAICAVGNLTGQDMYFQASLSRSTGRSDDVLVSRCVG